MEKDSIKFLIVNSNNNFLWKQFEEKIKEEYEVILFNICENPYLEITIKILNNDFVYTINLIYGSYNDYSKISISINNTIKENNSFDQFLENLKIRIKDILIEIWEQSHCFWIQDTQSENLSQNLYKKINQTENALRGFINICMIEYLGVYWWEKISAEKFGTKFNETKSKHYKNMFKNFNNIQDLLMSLNAEELKEVMELEIKKWNLPSNLKELENFLKLGDTNNFITKSKSYLVVEKNLWDDIFINFFERDFIGKWVEFCKGRNHIAHNKLIDLKYYSKFSQLMEKVNLEINKAHDMFSSKRISNEEKEALAEEFIQNQEIIKYMAEEESGVTIRNKSGILELFEEILNEFIDYIESEYTYREGVIVTIFPIDISEANSINILKINGTIFPKNELEIIYNCHIEDWESGNSYLEVIASLNQKEIAIGKLDYTNGEYEFNTENASYYPRTMDELDVEDFKNFEEKIIKIIDENFEDTYTIIENLKNDDLLFCDSYCKYCGEEAILKEEYNQIEKGRCLICNNLNNISSCDVDGIEFIKDNDDELDLCPNCKSELNYKINND